MLLRASGLALRASRHGAAAAAAAAAPSARAAALPSSVASSFSSSSASASASASARGAAAAAAPEELPAMLQTKREDPLLSFKSAASAKEALHYTSYFLAAGLPCALVLGAPVSTVVDFASGLIIPLHAHMGMRGVIIDYVWDVPQQRLALLALAGVTVLTAVGECDRWGAHRHARARSARRSSRSALSAYRRVLAPARRPHEV